MLLSSAALELAMARLLRERGARTGEGLPYQEIEHAWRASGLRATDLRDALRELLERGWLDCLREARGLQFALTPAGCRRWFDAAHCGARA